MNELEVLKKAEVSVADILGKARKIPTNNACTCDWLDDQCVSPERYQDRAESGFQRGDNRGLVPTATEIRSACRRQHMKR